MKDDAPKAGSTEQYSGAVVRDLLDIGAPGFFAFVAFLTGVVLLGAASAPGVFQNKAVLRFIAPLPILELSHFFASLIGTLLLFVAAGLRQRLDSAWLAAVILLCAGAVFSLLSGAHYWRAIALLAEVLLLSVSRHAFYRQSALREIVLPPFWTGAILFVLLGVAALGLFSFEEVQYRDDLWWTFAVDAEASRFLRAIVSAVALAVMILAWLLFQVRRAAPMSSRAPDIDSRIEAVIANGDNVRPDAHLAFLRDKRLLFSESGESFVMYGVQARNWIAMGPPVGNAKESRELAWAFKAHADSYGAASVFYSIDEGFLPIALDLGLVVQKVGESAIIPLDSFQLEGSRQAKLRQARRILGKESCAFEILQPTQVLAHLSDLKVVSDDWLRAHQGEEKQFTLGNFDENYLARLPAAVIRQEDRIIAFANLWAAPRSRELSIDLMRYASNVPHGVMDGLFVELIVWGKANGYLSLDLGMAPLAGLERRRLAPPMSRLGAFIFEHGEPLYGFEGLRRYKEKFHPIWKPLYIAAPSKTDVAFALGAVALLTSGGIRGIFGKKGAKG